MTFNIGFSKWVPQWWAVAKMWTNNRNVNLITVDEDLREYIDVVEDIIEDPTWLIQCEINVFRVYIVGCGIISH